MQRTHKHLKARGSSPIKSLKCQIKREERVRIYSKRFIKKRRNAVFLFLILFFNSCIISEASSGDSNRILAQRGKLELVLVIDQKKEKNI